jgi:hypothetical protein
MLTTRRLMAAKLTTLTHKIAIHLHLVAESCTICSSCSRRPVRKLLDTPSYSSFRPLFISLSSEVEVAGYTLRLPLPRYPMETRFMSTTFLRVTVKKENFQSPYPATKLQPSCPRSVTLPSKFEKLSMNLHKTLNC